MARVLKGFHSFTCTPRINPLTEWTIPAFAFPARAGTHLPTPEGWKAELASSGWLVTYRNKIDQYWFVTSVDSLPTRHLVFLGCWHVLPPIQT